MRDNRGSDHSLRIARRRLLEMGALSVGATILSACAPPSVSAPTAAPTTAPAAPPAAAPTATTAAPAAAATPTQAAAATKPAAAAPTTAPAAAPTQAAAATKPAVGAAAQTGATVKQPVEVVFNTWWQPLQDAFVVLTKEFQDQNPGVTIKTQFGGDDYTTKMEAGIVAGGFGDAATGDNGVQTKYMSAGHHYDLSAWVQSDNINLREHYALGGIEIWCGKVLQMPMDNDDRAVYYNKTMLKAAGAPDPWDDLKGKWTLDDMFEIAKKVTKTDGTGKVTQYGLRINYTDTEDQEPYIWSLGGNYADWETGKYDYLNPGLVKWLELVHKWATQDKVLITNEAVAAMQGSANANPFRGGIVAMFHRASYDSTINEKEIGNKFEWDAAPSPGPGSFNTALPSGVAGSTVNPNFVPKIAKNPEWGYKWIAYLAGDRAETLYAQKKTMMVANKAAWKAYQDSPPPKHSGSFVYYAFSRPYGYHYYSDIMNEVMYDTVQPELDKAFLGQQSVKDALTKAQKKIDTLGKSQSAGCPSPYTIGGSPLPAMSEAELNKWGVKPY
ncbi:MAG TPA: extracellular solute-binding protein [Chloroflexota bacterium]